MKTIIDILKNTFKTMLSLCLLVGMILSGIAIVFLIACGWVIHCGWSLLGLSLLIPWTSMVHNERFLSFISGE